MNDQKRQRVLQNVEENLQELYEIRTYLYEHPEVGGEEKLAYEKLTGSLKAHGFDVTGDFHGIDYCFRAVYDSGREGATIGLTCEFDALPGMGHGCGHDIIAAAPLGAAFALQSILDETGGRVILYGTPGEECVCSKVQLSEEGAFDEADVVMTVHPNPTNLSSGATTAIDAIQVDFYGKSSHAGMAPDEGINALDAAVYFYTMINVEKQYLKDVNIYGVFADGGKKCSVIPDHAAVKYLARAKDMESMAAIWNMFERCAKGAAAAVGAEYKVWRNEPANKNMINNRALSEVFNRNYEELGGGFMPRVDSTGSTDMGDVSHVRPAIHPWLGMNCPDLQLHSKEFADMTITPEGDKVIKLGASALALTGLEVLTDASLLAEIKAEFDETHAR